VPLASPRRYPRWVRRAAGSGGVRGHSGKVDDDRDPDLAQVRARADARAHQQLGRADRTGRQHDFTAALHIEDLRADAVLDTCAPLAAEDEPVHQRVGDEIEVRPLQRRYQVGVRCALPPAVDDRELRPAESFLHAAVEIVDDRMTDLSSRLQHGLRQWVRRRRPPQPQRTAAAPQGRVSALDVLTAFEEGQQVVEPPAIRSGRDPRVIARPVPSDERHRIDRRGPTHTATARQPHRRATGHTHRHVAPVHRGTRQRRPGLGIGGSRQRIPTPCLHQQHSRAGVLGQPGREHTTSRPGTNDHEVVRT
jgi:hypothetical protein